MSPIDLGVIAVYVAGLHRRWGAGSGRGRPGLKGYFLGESNIPAWAVMISIVATETSTATFLSVPGVAYKGDFTFLQLAFGYILGRVVVATVLLPAYFRGEIFTAYQVLQNAVRRADPDDGLDPLPRHPLARRRPPAVPRRHGAPAAHRLADRRRRSWPWAGHDRLHFPRRDEGGDLDRRHPVQRLHPRRPGGARDPGGQAPRRLGPSCGRRPATAASSACSTSRFDLTRTLYVLGRPDRRHGPEHGDPRGRPDDGPALPRGPIAAAGGRWPWWPAGS